MPLLCVLVALSTDNRTKMGALIAHHGLVLLAALIIILMRKDSENATFSANMRLSYLQRMSRSA